MPKKRTNRLMTIDHIVKTVKVAIHTPPPFNASWHGSCSVGRRGWKYVHGEQWW